MSHMPHGRRVETPVEDLLPADLLAARPRVGGAGVALRSDGGLQIGVEHGVVLRGLDGGEVALLRRLDGSTDVRSLLAAQASTGRDPGRFAETVRLLADSGAIMTAPVADMSAARVVIDGHGRLAETVVDRLADIGCRDVRAGALSLDVLGLERGAVLPDLVVLTSAVPIAPETGRECLALGLRHLPVVVDDRTATVGPLVEPGRPPCLECVDSGRADRDPSWPALRNQLSGAPLVATGPVGGGSTLTGFAAALTALVVACALRGDAPAGVSFDVCLPWPRVVQRRWSPHPGCACGRMAP